MGLLKSIIWIGGIIFLLIVLAKYDILGTSAIIYKILGYIGMFFQNLGNILISMNPNQNL